MVILIFIHLLFLSVTAFCKITPREESDENDNDGNANTFMRREREMLWSDEKSSILTVMKTFPFFLFIFIKSSGGEEKCRYIIISRREVEARWDGNDNRKFSCKNYLRASHSLARSLSISAFYLFCIQPTPLKLN